MIACGSSASAALTTYAINGAPPISCSTFARRDFILVPRPAAMIKTFRGLDDVLLVDISRKIFRQRPGRVLVCGSRDGHVRAALNCAGPSRRRTADQRGRFQWFDPAHRQSNREYRF